ncbi:hydroxymethylbilane synthase [uncultured Methanobacterium sp.]|uniref:hydroxymethylbilane synthase n=1 Tax=uncultured Methanobacterium sp. TaxID=176306 RepID=UPI002AA82C0A|nr:hydroxymethylbilane synthase [uncultured Methanobacterium sp.]
MQVGTRGSSLAMVQTKNIITSLSKITDEKIDITVIKTTGDKIKDSQLYQMDVKGIFTKELDRAVLEEEVDFAVHSLKDLPSELDDELEIVAIPLRESPHDVLVSPYQWEDLPEGATLGTSSVRREAFCKYHQKNVDIQPIRGNIETRIKKVTSGEYQATLLAEAGLNRLGLTEHLRERFSLDYMTPAAGQGALAVVSRKDSSNKNILKELNHKYSYNEIMAERKVLEELGVGCQWPLGVCARAQGDKLKLQAILLNREGELISKHDITGSINQAESIGLEIARSIGEDC